MKNEKGGPMINQYDHLKAQYDDCVLFFRLGDFYELFREDAIEMSKVLDLTLTKKSAGNGTVPMCGIPHHAVEGYINKLIDKGYTIAICEQLDTTPISKVVQRDVVRIITPGTVMEESVLDSQKNNYITCIYQVKNRVGVAQCDISTGQLLVADYNGEDYLNSLNDFLNRSLPSEIIVHSTYDLESMLSGCKLKVFPAFKKYDDENFNKNICEDMLVRYFGINFAVDYDLKDKSFAQIAAGALLKYLEETQKRKLSHITKIEQTFESEFMQMDINTRRNLEILETLKDRRRRGALLSVIDKTKTAMGARTLKNWVQKPLLNEKEINFRLDAVSELIKNLIHRDTLSTLLREVADIERICGRVAYGNFTPRDAVSLRATLSLLPQITKELESFNGKKFNSIREKMPDLSEITKLLFDTFVDEPPANISLGNFIKPKFNAELDEYRGLKTNSIETINKLQQKEREITQIDSLKITSNKVSGFFIEVHKNFAAQVPLRYIRKQTVSDKDRYITEELKVLEDKIEHADENACKLELLIFKEVRNKLLEYCQDIQLTAKLIAELDCLLSFAEVATKNNYCRPKVSSKIRHIKIEDGRHPVVEDLSKNSLFIPNDTNMDDEENQVMIITGPNMAGKSTYMRQVALITLLAHIGCFVPAKSAEIALTDKIFTRVGASDDLALGQSTFMVEMMEVSYILQNATQNSLVILDEIGRGTSTYDGLSIAWAVVEEIKKIHCKTLFSTHYHELTELENFMTGIKNYKIAIKEINGRLVFLRKIQRGGANRSYGIEVAQLAGVKDSVITRAKDISLELEKNDMSQHIVKSVSNDKEEVKKLEKSYTNVIGIIKDVDINRLNPLTAFEILVDLVQKVKE